MKEYLRRMVETRRLYKFEEEYLYKNRYISSPRSERFLKSLASRVWEKHGRENLPVPSVKIVDGAKWSTCKGYKEIALATSKNTRRNLPHNTIDVLLHELTHAIGFSTHGHGFVGKYSELLVEYGRCDPGELRMAMEMFGISPKRP
jgi:hypothetical protein